jgi:hypothetical protein
MGEKGRKVWFRIAVMGAGILLGSMWIGAGVAEASITAHLAASSPAATPTSAPSGTGTIHLAGPGTTAPGPGTTAPASRTGESFCRYFPSQPAAQVYFTSVGGSATNNVRDLDANHNGIACEDYTYRIAVPFGVGASSASGSVPTRDQDCRDFPSRAAAQNYFTSIGGSAMNNADFLDANHNGLACEDHDYRASESPGSGTAAGTQGSMAGPAQVPIVPHGGVNTGDGSFPR